MNDTAIKNFAIWARRELISDVQKRCMKYGILEKGSLPGTADTIDGRVLTSAERQQRAELLRLAADGGYRELVEQAAYTWFNRLLAIRFMELNDRLPSHVRVLSGTDGSFRPQALAEAMDLPLEALDQTQVAELVQRGDDETLFRAIFLAQCDELAACMPAVFEKIGGSMELLLPDGLLREGGVVEKLVTSIPEEDWREGVEIVGWMYQYYVSERKDEVFASFKKGKKAERDSIAPATQLFTPNWIVRYLTENSLGRLWMLNRPDSELPKDMPYFVKPDEDAETEFRKISSPEEITVVDPACGSGHILVYAFELLSKMYIEDGYTGRDAARLILEKNLSGMEIDPRAGAMASFALTMKACELDSRFLRRGVSPRITVLSRVEFEPEELQYVENLRNRPELMDAAAHLDECGSLLTVSSDDLEAIARDLASLAGEETIFGGFAAEKLERLQTELEPLSRRYDVVVANPPYMGSSSLSKWMGAWVKKHYPEAYRDLCTSFIDQGFGMSSDNGYSAMVTMQSWMFLGSFEKLRGKILRNHSISSMAHLGTRAFGAIGGEVVSTTATVFANAKSEAKGAYFRLVDMGSEKEKQAGLLEALANPDCGWFYRASTSNYKVIPGTPIAYWASKSVLDAFANFSKMEAICVPKTGMRTGDNERFLRYWFEVSDSLFGKGMPNASIAMKSGRKWFPYNKGGNYRMWYGNNELLVNWKNDGEAIKDNTKKAYPQLGDNLSWKITNERDYFRPGITWTALTSGVNSFRWSPAGSIFDSNKGPMMFPDKRIQYSLLGLLSSSVTAAILGILNPSLSLQNSDIGKMPVNISKNEITDAIVRDCIDLAKYDWDSFEVSWDFERHPLI